MEKFRAVLEKLQKYHFWIICGLIVLLAFVSWFFATGSVANRYFSRKKTIDGEFSAVNAIAMNNDHPSEKDVEFIGTRESGPLTEQVGTASKLLYDDQRKNNRLHNIFGDPADQARFEAAFEKIWGPMEEIAKLPTKQLQDVYLRSYRNHIATYFPELFKLIDRRTEVDDPKGSDPRKRGPNDMGMLGGDAAGGAKKLVGIVDWKDADKKIKSVSERLPNDPTTLDIMLAQEDLWVYETLLKVIRNTNHKPASHKVAPIKEILAMDIGKDAVDAWGKCEKALFNLSGESGGEVVQQKGAGAGTSAGHGSKGAGQVSGDSLLADRYVDDNGKPLADPNQQPYAEFRMMPINLKVVIEQREIPRLLAECANSAMRIDVRRVRFLAQDPGPVDLTAAEAPAGQANPAGETVAAQHGAHQTTKTGGTGHLPGGSSTGAKGEFEYTEESADPVYPPVPVEVQGVIYIYNPRRAQEPGEVAGGNGGQVVPVAPTPAGQPPATLTPAGQVPAVPANGGAVPATNKTPTGGAANVSPANGPQANPPTKTPASGGRP